MKIIYKKILPFTLSVEILILSFFSCPISVYAADFMPTDIIAAVEYGVENGDWQPFYRFLYNSSDGLMYLVSQMGAVVNKDFQTWVDNNQKLETFTNVVPARKDDNSIVFTKEFMAQLKALLDEYAKEHEPYYLVNTLTLADCAGNSYNGSKIAYDTVKNLLADSPSGIVAWGCYYSNPTDMWFVDIGNDFKNVSAVKYNENKLLVNFYDNEEWGQKTYTSYNANVGTDGEAISTAEEFKEKAQRTYENQFMNTTFRVYPFDNPPGTYPYDARFPYSYLSLITKERRRIRVFNTYGDFQNYTLGKRSVYYTKEYYSYVPEDLTTSIDDLQESVDDLQKVLDDLLSQISKDTDESEIEDLLRQILDELKNQQGTGNGGGSSGGDVTVNVDLSYTNSLLERIHLQLRSIWDEIHKQFEILNENFKKFFIFEDAPGINMRYITSLFERMLEQLRGISDDLGDIKGQLADMSEQEFSKQTESFLDDTMDSFMEITEKAKGKFPFSIPNDIRLLISKMSVSHQEEPGPGTYKVMTMAYDDDVGDSGLISVMDESGGDVPIISETGAPIFYLPFVIASAGIEQYVLIDLSGFEPISSFCRSLMTVWFLLCLYNLTFKVMGLWGDLVD